MARLIVDSDREIFVAGLASLLSQAGHELLCGCADGGGLIAAARSSLPDLVVLSQRLGLDSSPVEIASGLRRLACPPKVILLLERAPDVAELTGLEPDGIVVSSPHVDKLLRCIDAVVAGGRWVDPEVLQLISGSQTSPATRFQPTLREQEIVDRVRAGMRNKQIAQELKLSEGTVKMYLHQIFVKYKVSSRTELALARLGDEGNRSLRVDGSEPKNGTPFAAFDG